MRSSVSLAVGLTIGMLPLLPAPASAAKVTFTDQRGKLVTLDGPARRVVAFPKPVPSLYIAVDAMMPSASDSTATVVNPGFLRRFRRP